MKTEIRVIRVRDLLEGYSDDGDGGVTAYGGKLVVRPEFQREFVYKDKQRDEVVNTVTKGTPLGLLHFSDNHDGTYELLDGQQRTISLGAYVTSDFSINHQFFHNLDESERDQILDYELLIHMFSGTPKEKMKVFKSVNTHGEHLNPQEIRNAACVGPWLADMKKKFSRSGCAAESIGAEYVSGSAIRQDYLAAALKWISDGEIEDYMAARQQKPAGTEQWLYFTSVIQWVKTVFPNYRKEMKTVPWGYLYNEFKDDTLVPAELEARVTALMRDEEVTSKPGVYTYVLAGDDRALSLRSFNKNQKREAYERQGGACAGCGGKFDLTKMQADHKKPWSRGGKTVPSNCQLLCRECNSIKSNT